MRRLLVLVALCVCCAGEAWGATYYIRTDGSNSNDGLDNTNLGAWLTIEHANQRLQAGDTLNIQTVPTGGAGTIPTTSDTTHTAWNTAYKIDPDNNGLGYGEVAGNPPGQGPIVYRVFGGAALVGPISNISINKRYIIVEGVRSKAGVSMSSASEPSTCVSNVVSNCWINGRVALTGAVRCRVSHNVMLLDGESSVGQIRLGSGSLGYAPPFAAYDTLRYNYVEMEEINTAASYGFHMKFYVNNCVIDSNIMVIPLDHNTGSGSHPEGFNLQESYSCQFKDNRWDIRFNGPPVSGTTYKNSIRSGSRFHTFTRDTFLFAINANDIVSVGGGSTYPFYLGQSSTPDEATFQNWELNYPDHTREQAHSNQFYYCVFKSRFLYFGAQHALDRYRFENCTFYSSGSGVAPFSIEFGMRATTIKNCTFFSRHGYALMTSSSQPWSAGTGNTVVNNIFWGGSADNGCDQFPVVNYPCTVHLQDPVFVANAVTWNRNLYYGNYSNPASTGAKQMSLHRHSGSCVGPPGPTGSYCTSSGRDCQSVSGLNPIFSDTTRSGFDATLGAGSPAIGGSWCGTPGPTGECYAGAKPPLDLIPPSVPVITTISCTGVVTKRIEFTVGGDDSTFGTADSVYVVEVPYPFTATAATFHSFPSLYAAVAPASGTSIAINCTPTGANSCGSDAPIAPDNYVGYICIKVTDGAGNASYSLQTLLDCP